MVEALFPSGQVTSHALVIVHELIRVLGVCDCPPWDRPCMDDPLWLRCTSCNDQGRRFLRRS